MKSLLGTGEYMKKNKKLLLMGVLLLLLAGCTAYMDPETGKVMTNKIIAWGDAWSFGTESWFDAFFIWPIAQVLNFFTPYVGAFFSIVLVSVLLKMLTIRSTIKSTVQQQKMQLLGPEQARIEAKYRGRDDQQSKLKKATEIQNLYKKHDINPMGALGGMILTLPILLAMYQSVARAQSIINGTVLGQPLEGTPMQGFKTLNWVYIVIFVAMVVIQVLSMSLPQHMAKKKMKQRPNDPKPASNPQAMMYVSVAMISIFGLNWPIGMSLYLMISSLITLIQTLYINHKYVD